MNPLLKLGCDFKGRKSIVTWRIYKCAVLAACFLLLPAVVAAATICRLYNLEGYEANAARAKQFVPTRGTENGSGMVVYIERDSLGNPYYHSNFLAHNSREGGRYQHSTKIGGEKDPVTRITWAFAQIIWDGNNSSNISARAVAAQDYMNKATVYIDKSVFENGGPRLDLTGLKKFILVDTNKHEKIATVQRKSKKKNSEGGVTDCEVVYWCEKSGGAPKLCSSTVPGKKIENGVVSMLCESH